MIAFIIVVMAAALVFNNIKVRENELSEVSYKIADKIDKLWKIAHEGMKGNRLLRAEKALLTILKIDEKNAAAYNRLGILYAKQKEYKDAIDCFEIASSIDPSASSLHNLGLIYYETEHYEKAALAFEQALKLDESLAARHIAYAKVQEKQHNIKLMIEHLERAVELEPNPESFNLLIKAYDTVGETTKADTLRTKLGKLQLPSGTSKRVFRPRKVVI